LLQSLETDLAMSATLDTRKLEDSLTGLERMLNQVLLSSLPSTDLEKAKAEIKAQLKSYKRQMEASAYQQTFDNLLLKRLREQLGIPRLSLFYL
jgi:hypothetical protein